MVSQKGAHTHLFLFIKSEKSACSSYEIFPFSALAFECSPDSKDKELGPKSHRSRRGGTTRETSLGRQIPVCHLVVAIFYLRGIILIGHTPQLQPIELVRVITGGWERGSTQLRKNIKLYKKFVESAFF